MGWIRWRGQARLQLMNVEVIQWIVHLMQLLLMMTEQQ